MGTAAIHEASAPFSEEMATLRLPVLPDGSTENTASLSRCHLRDVHPFGLSPSISSKEPLATNCVTPASSSSGWGALALHETNAITVRPASSTVKPCATGLRGIFIMAPSRPDGPRRRRTRRQAVDGKEECILASAACQRLGSTCPRFIPS